ncbi:unnamed protein product [Ilex paraguariensis]|uniref:Uncharacterized protein n=1 Tax=Ilex paraguariensis TaxID=185542 RepID=A0ABC8UPQ4_9AQUA
MCIRTQPLFLLQSLLFFFLSFNTVFCTGIDTIFPGQTISGNQTITSRGGRFELGYFKPGNSEYFYIGIWYKTIKNHTMVWVANRDKPLPDPFSSKLELSVKGELILLKQSKTKIWSTRSSSNILNATIAVLEDNGNLVLRKRSNSSVIVWQSFDHPTDNWLPGAKLGLNKLNHQRQIYRSWKDVNDPAPGTFSLELDPNGVKQYFITWNSYRHGTCGFWPGGVSVFGSNMLVDNYIKMVYKSNEKENYFAYSPKHQCEIYAFCGEYGWCNQYSVPTCRCLQGFEPKCPEEWSTGNYSHGCVRQSSLQCGRGGKDGFLTIPNITLPANPVSLAVRSSDKCKLACLRNCSCTGYIYDTECLIWQEDLLRLAMPELITYKSKTKGRINDAIISAAVAFVAILGIILGLVITWRCKKMKLLGLQKAKENSLKLFNYRRRNSDTKEDDIDDYFPAQVMKRLIKGDEIITLLDYQLGGNADMEEVTRACRVAGWCIQDDKEERPSMGHVVQVLEGVLEVITPPIPRFLEHISKYLAEKNVFN